MVAGCTDTYSGYSYATPASIMASPHPPSARELAAVETAQAENTREAMENDARGTAEVLANDKQATQQALDLKGTQWAQEANVTREAWEFSKTQTMEAVQATITAELSQATATRQAIDATATEVQVQATITTSLMIANVQRTQTAATAQAISRQSASEAQTQTVRTWVGWALLPIGLVVMGYLGFKGWQVIEARSRVIRRKADEGEPMVLLEKRDENGYERIALPLREARSLLPTGQVPALPSPEMQDAATMRQQTTNAIQARQVAATVKGRKAHRSKAPQIVAGRPASSRRKQLTPGLGKVVVVDGLKGATDRGILNQQLADAIDGQWSEQE